ncbi:hypothetical protein D0C36_09775 [Mucilaginibacter conchicola]|uniref:Aminoglycoside phosphotransferase domain-containing protein n=1 Tax=Mucilaginibacter conchicola TaxID=2303333 RepID=A0A372NR60_9SPHI|nr:phosphotransferase [Mucilaginibacter conchicola]RFZ91738.1 hypothetical protein D0C36_09775 [Mucilaginibacter conchicola]
MNLIHNTLKPSQITAAENALKNAFGVADVEEIEILAGGLSASSVYKIKVNGCYYTLKSDTPSVPVNDLSASCMEVAALAGIAPPVIYLDKSSGISITAFIEQMPLSSVYGSAEALLPQLANTIRAIHSLPVFEKDGNLKNTVDGLLHQFKTAATLTGPVIDECLALYNTIKENYPWDDPGRVSSHNDLNPNNIIFDGQKIWVIDWDAAFKNDRYVDLAIAANFYVSTDEQEHIFLSAYFENDLTDYHKARFFIMRQICRLVYAMLMFQLADKGRLNGTPHDNDMHANLADIKKRLGNGSLSLATYDGQLLLGKALWNEALINMRSARFSASIEHLVNQKL